MYTPFILHLLYSQVNGIKTKFAIFAKFVCVNVLQYSSDVRGTLWLNQTSLNKAKQQWTKIAILRCHVCYSNNLTLIRSQTDAEVITPPPVCSL